jgi:hypothetical protein
MHTEIALSSTESEYVAMSQALREVLPLTRLVAELRSANFEMSSSTPKILCKIFEDYKGALEMARTPKMRPLTKHMDLRYHNFREAVEAGLVTIHAVEQLIRTWTFSPGHCTRICSKGPQSHHGMVDDTGLEGV